jgi:hypothetical protein
VANFTKSEHAGQTIFGQTGGDDPAVKVEHLRVPEHADRLVLLLDHREQTAVVGRAHDDLAVGEQLRRVGTGRPPDHVCP